MGWGRAGAWFNNITFEMSVRCVKMSRKRLDMQVWQSPCCHIELRVVSMCLLFKDAGLGEVTDGANRNKRDVQRLNPGAV